MPLAPAVGGQDDSETLAGFAPGSLASPSVDVQTGFRTAFGCPFGMVIPRWEGWALGNRRKDLWLTYLHLFTLGDPLLIELGRCDLYSWRV